MTETASQVAEKGVVAAVQARAEAFPGLRLDVDLAGGQQAFVGGRILGTQARVDIRRAVRPHRRQLDRLIGREVVQVSVRPVEDGVVKMYVEMLQGIIDGSWDGRLADAIEIDVVETAHFHRGHLRPEREHRQKQE